MKRRMSLKKGKMLLSGYYKNIRSTSMGEGCG